MKWFYEHLNNFFITHLVSIIIFAVCYYFLLNNIDEHFIVNKELKSFYNENPILNAVFIWNTYSFPATERVKSLFAVSF